MGCRNPEMQSGIRSPALPRRTRRLSRRGSPFGDVYATGTHVEWKMRRLQTHSSDTYRPIWGEVLLIYNQQMSFWSEGNTIFFKKSKVAKQKTGVT
jgi:hypothetical protein